MYSFLIHLALCGLVSFGYSIDYNLIHPVHLMVVTAYREVLVVPSVASGSLLSWGQVPSAPALLPSRPHLVPHGGQCCKHTGACAAKERSPPGPPGGQSWEVGVGAHAQAHPRAFFSSPTCSLSMSSH